MNKMLKYYLIAISLTIAIVGCASKEVIKPKEAYTDLTPEELIKASGMFFNRCAGCHGTLREGGTGPNVTDTKLKEKNYDTNIIKAFISNGTGGGMPSWGGYLSIDDIDLLARFLQTPPPAAPSEIKPEQPQTLSEPLPPQKPPKKLPQKLPPKDKVPPKPQVSPYIIARSCDNNCDSYKPEKLYLYGGKARELFEAYLSENNGIKKRIPDNFHILFYEKNGIDLKLAEPVSAHWMLGMVVDSKEAFLNILKDKLGTRVAERPNETDDALINKALSEKADIILCCRKAQTKKGKH